MKILNISTTAIPCPPTGYAGLEQLAWQIADGLALKGHQSDLVAPTGSHFPNGTLFNVGPPTIDEKLAWFNYRHLLRDYDVVIDHSWQKWSYVTKNDENLEVPIIGVWHGMFHASVQSAAPCEYPCFVCISEDHRDAYREIWPSDPIPKVIYNGVDPDFYNDISFVDRGKRFLFLARFSPEKGADIAISACRQVGVGLDLVGDTSLIADPKFLKHCVDQADVVLNCGELNKGEIDPTRDDQIVIHGSATRGECAVWFNKAKALIHPIKRFREPFGLAPVEAQLCGCPVISWDNGALCETLRAEYPNFLVSTEKELVDAVDDLEETQIADSCSLKLRKHASRFSYANMIDNYEQACYQAIKGEVW